MTNPINSYSHTVPLPIKLFCSFFIWLPIFISFISLWYYPSLTIIYNIIISIYVIITVFLTYVTALFSCLQQKQIIGTFFRSSEWIRLKEFFRNQRSNNKNNSNQIEDILHMILIPVYKEDPFILDATLKSLAKQNVSMLIGLALEQREIHSDTKYNSIIEKHEKQFLKIIKTIHPEGLPNEIPGKGSNCNSCLPVLIDYYEEYYQNSYPHVMVTPCDCDSIWCEDYFLYLNYLCTRNNLKFFNHRIYSPSITNLNDFQANHILTNYMSILRSLITHGHFRRLGSLRCFTSEYHIPLNLLQRIDYWDGDLIHEDVHMRNKLAILDVEFLVFQQTYLPCDNQTPTDNHSTARSFVLLWNQSLRWNLFVYDVYYLVHVLLLKVLRRKSYENFQTNPWKIMKEIVNNYENLFYFFVVPLSNNLFWIIYLCRFHHQPYDHLTDFLLNYLQPWSIFAQVISAILYLFVILNSNGVFAKGRFYSWKKSIFFILGFIPIYLVSAIYQGMNVIIAWIYTLRSSNTHTDSALKTIPNPKDE